MNAPIDQSHAHAEVALPLSQRFAKATRTMHQRAERSGVMNALLRGQLEPGRYCLLLRNLHALYAAMEGALDRQGTASVATIRMPALYRTAALERDLLRFYGDAWRELAITDAMRRYVSHIENIAQNQPVLLAAHAYVRYMGDLSGGQILSVIVGRTYSLDAINAAAAATAATGTGTEFYEFGNDIDVVATKKRFREALDALPLDPETAEHMTIEAVAGFARHVELFEELEGTIAVRG